MIVDTSTSIKSPDHVDDYVTVSVARKVIQGQEKKYERWVSEISAAASQFPGHLGVNILRPSMGYNQYTIIYRFDSHEHAEAWSVSPDRQKMTEKLQGIVEGEDQIREINGLESWFDLPTISIEKHPVRWRMSIVLVVVVFGLISIISFLLSPILSMLNPHVARALVISLQVILMTYVVMPRVTQLLKGWLYR